MDERYQGMIYWEKTPYISEHGSVSYHITYLHLHSILEYLHDLL